MLAGFQGRLASLWPIWGIVHVLFRFHNGLRLSFVVEQACELSLNNWKLFVCRAILRADFLRSIHFKGAHNCYARKGQNVLGGVKGSLWFTGIWKTYLAIWQKNTERWCKTTSGESLLGFTRSSERASYIMLDSLLVFAAGSKLTERIAMVILGTVFPFILQ
jgi:hypothetical protein